MNQSCQSSASAHCPLVTVIIPVYNHEGFVADCIGSVLDQDYRNIELIVINDGSTDSTDPVIRKILDATPNRFRYIEKHNEGLVKTLNLGLTLARGELFCEIASDDMLLPGSIGKRVRFLAEHPEIDAVFADALLMEQDLKTQVRLGAGKVRFDSSEHSIRDLIEGKARILFPSGLFRTAALRALGGFDEEFRYFEDLAMRYRLAITRRIGYLDEPVMYYRKHASNVSSTNEFRVRREKILELEKLSYLNREDIKDLVIRHLGREYQKFIKLALRDRVEQGEVAEVMKKALALHPFSLKVRLYAMILKVKGMNDESA